MTPRYDSLRNHNIDRDESIREYARQHPDYAHQEIARYFGLSRSRITQILGASKVKKTKKEKEEK